MDQGFIKLHRKLLIWEWYTDNNVKILFIHCLLKANWEDKKFKGKVIPRGSLLTSYDKLSKELKLTQKQIILALSKLKRTNEVATEKMLNGTLISVINYENYQSDSEQKGRQRANKWQTEGRRRATTKEYKESKKLKEINNLDNFMPLIDSFTGNENLKSKIIEFIKFRKSIKKELYVETFENWLSKLKRLSDDEQTQILIISESLANGWQGIFSINQNNQKTKKDVLPANHIGYVDWSDL